ncbi:TPA: hypothetical protein ACPSKB_000965 [Legionella feeleii]|uniref:Uncharacterized protein n=1 Tax=Legionella feeleii TaxID=453 RepID=A0A378IXC9_9GAMM|nr:hypothetical protein [Legionella feeleii]STX39886.1 Uncharacterised protein [Legionella feeleii]
MLRFFQHAALQTAKGTGTILAAAAVTNITYSLGSYAYTYLNTKLPLFSKNPSLPPTGAGTTNHSHDHSNDDIPTGTHGFGA